MTTRSRTIGWTTALAVMTAALLQLSAHPALAKKKGGSSLKGHVENVGSGKANGKLRLSGTASGAGALDLAAATLEVTSFLSEPRGSFDLVGADQPPFPRTLSARKGAKATKAVFESESDRPKVVVTITKRDSSMDDYDFELKVKRAVIAADPSCTGRGSETERRTRLSLADGTYDPVKLQIRHKWRCKKNELKNPAAVPPLGLAASPEEQLIDMSLELGLSIAGDQLNSALFGDGIDYQTLLDDFKTVLEDALQDNDIQVATANVTGYSTTLNQQQADFCTFACLPCGNSSSGNTTTTTLPCTVDTVSIQSLLDTATTDVVLINDDVSNLESYGNSALAGWVAGANVSLNAYAFMQQMYAFLHPGNTSYPYNQNLASLLDQYIRYLAQTRNSILHQNILDSLHPCSEYDGNDNPFGSVEDRWEFHNCNGAWQTDFGHSASCEIESLSEENTVCGQTTFDDETSPDTGSDGNVEWMSQVVDNWRQALAALAPPNTPAQLPPNALPCITCRDVGAYIVVDKMLTGVRNGIPVETTWWVKAACDDLQTCDYQLESENFIQEYIQSDTNDHIKGVNAITSVEVTYHCGADTTPRVASLAFDGTLPSALYDGAYLHLDCAPAVQNLQATVKGQPVQVKVSDGIVSVHKPLVASRITDGRIADEGHSAADTSYVVILPHNGNAGALVIDLGAKVTICGNGYQCYSEPEIQADNDDVYQLDYLNDQGVWTKYGQFPTTSGEGLHSRTFKCNTRPNTSQPCSASNHGPNFSTQYVRVWAPSGGNTFAVSELRLWDSTSAALPSPPTSPVPTPPSPISVGKPVLGPASPAPLITDGIFAAPSTSWNSSTYATVIQDVGPLYGLTIDLGQVYTLTQVKIQAGQNSYQVDVSTDGASWVNFYSVPAVASPSVTSSGLQTRSSGQLPPAAGRYVRVYGVVGDAASGNEFSVSELEIYANSGALAPCTGERICGESAAVVLGTAAPSDVAVHWTCSSGDGSDTTAYTANGVPWDVTWSSYPYPDAAVVQPSCPRSTVPPCPTNSPPGDPTCSHFAEDATNDVVYDRVASIPYQLSGDYPNCPSVLAGKTNYYHTDPSTPATHQDAACQNVQRAINDAVTEGDCPAGIGATAGDSWEVWPYNVGIGVGGTAVHLVDPANGQPPLLDYLGCYSLLK